jgi:hypothetical protein
MQNNYEPYYNGDPYSKGNPYQNNSNTNDQRRRDDDQKKQKYKMEMERGFDTIVKDYIDAKNNDTQWTLNFAAQVAIRRYYHQYWVKSFYLTSFVIALLTAILSLYSLWAFVGVLLAFTFRCEYCSYC